MDIIELLKSSDAGKMLITFIVSMLPIVELRGAIPIGVAMGLNPVASTVISLVGNMVPVPFIILFIRRIFTWMKGRSRRLANIAEKLESKAQAKGSALYKGEVIGLAVFVAIPLPGTGAWTGALIAAILGMRLKIAVPTIVAGVLVAGLIIFGITYGFTAIF
ncbi:MAG: small multi-drug export protein [Clostridiales bacterium]|nr:small multi-drug export protein [Clostridiales bacterium]